MKILERLTAKFNTDDVKLRDILRSLVEMVKDGDIDTEDYPELVSAVKEFFAVVIPLINVPYIPDAMESVAFDSWAIPLAQGYADEVVAGVFGAFNIPVKDN